MRHFVTIIVLSLFAQTTFADEIPVTSDSIVVNELRKDGVTFTNDNDVKLLMTGQEKFDDMFEAIRNARRSVHLEYSISATTP